MEYTAFPLSFMRQDQARALAVRVLTDFGEASGVSGGPSTMVRTTSLRLEAARPNPFRRSTTVSYALPKTGTVNLDVYNIAGQKVRTLVAGDMPAGAHAVGWDGKSQTGQTLSAGVYLVHLRAGGLSLTGKLTLIR
ncbi:MAG: T9SS type A sorting domain-containing protein [Candidatus Edwardsbacteria bacterium]|nr:T9SS type A sorting domain-containing protein [Candidatus Edwardsbacteria bacterium]